METHFLDKQVRTNKRGYESIINLYNSLRICPSRNARIDFSNCIRFDANLAAALGAIIGQLEEDGIQVWVVPPSSTGVKRTLSRNHFLKAFEVETTNEERESFIKYQKFSSSDESRFKEYINNELINKENFPKHTDLVGKNITENIYEIYANAIIHGDSNYVYSCGEYDGDSATPKLNMTLVDCGVSIHKNVSDYFIKQKKTVIDSCEAIKWAMEERNTTKPTTGGLGLSILKNFISLNKGSMQIISFDGMYEFRDGNVSTSFLNKPFPGTIVNMEFNFNDDKFYYMSEEEENINLNDLL